MKPRTDQISALLNRLLPIVGVVLFGVAIAVVHHEVQVYKWSQIRDAITGLSPQALLVACGVALLGYLVLTFYDWLALEYAGEHLPYRRVALAAFLSYAISNNVGHALVSGGSMRYRMYSGWGVPPSAIAKVVVFCALTYMAGAITLFVGAALFTPASQLATEHLSVGYIHALLAIAVVSLLIWWGVTAYSQFRPVCWRGYRVELPSLGMSLKQTAVAVIDLLVAGLVLYVLLRSESDVALGRFILIFIMAQLLGLFSQVPGGIGVFESSFLVLTAGKMPPSQVLAALIAYRVIYYFLPLALAGLVLLAYEIRQSGLLKTRVLRSTLITVDAATPQIFSLLLLLGGTLLLMSAATPIAGERLHWLGQVLPLPLMEVSHLAGGVCGVALLVLANALRHRLESAWRAAVAVLAIAIAVSLGKGLDYVAVIFLTPMLATLLPARKHFYRRSSLLNASLPQQWYLLALPILVVSTWLGFFSYKHVTYSDQLWLEFSLHGGASRFLRSLLVSGLTLAAFFGYRLLSRTTVRLELPSTTELARAAALARADDDTNAHLALTGDKYLLWSDSGNSFAMFDVAERYWIALGDPVGDPQERSDLVWKLRELADQSRAKVAFYQIGSRNLPIYLDLGMPLLKLGEEARLYLAGFSLHGRHNAALLAGYEAALQAGLTFDVIGGEAVAAVMPELGAVSERWLKARDLRERRFAMGFFNPDYLRHCRIAVVRHAGHIVAFANLWELDSREELAVDLLRSDPEAATDPTEFLTTSLLQWAQAQGYLWFNLGLAPSANIERHALATVWRRIGSTIFRLRRDFAEVETLKPYRDTFDPVWQPRYLAVPAGLSSATALLTATHLISGGTKGIFSQ